MFVCEREEEEWKTETEKSNFSILTNTHIVQPFQEVPKRFIFLILSLITQKEIFVLILNGK